MATESPPGVSPTAGAYLGRVIRRFIAAGLHERDLIGWVIAYADPTGEQAVRNVMRAARGSS